jgi:hypothetical protein
MRLLFGVKHNISAACPLVVCSKLQRLGHTTAFPAIGSAGESNVPFSIGQKE